MMAETYKIAIIGSGPAGMAASAYLAQNGYQVDVYEKNDRAGGLMIYGIPNFKLDKNIVERRTQWLQESGVKFNLNTEVGKNISFQDLEKDYDAILIATGSSIQLPLGTVQILSVRMRSKIDPEYRRIFLNDSGSPALIKDPGDFDSIFVVMPMKG